MSIGWKTERFLGIGCIGISAIWLTKMTDYAKYREYQLKYRREMFRNAEKDTDCICPGCGFGHSVVMYWTGKGTPKIFCPDCVEGVVKFEADEEGRARV